MHGVAGREGQGKDEMAAGIDAGEVTRENVGGVSEVKLDETEAMFFWFECGRVGENVVVEKHGRPRLGERGGGGG